MRLIYLGVFLLTLTACSGDFPSGPWPPMKKADFPTYDDVRRWPVAVRLSVVAGGVLVIADDYGVFRSNDKGRSWSELQFPPESTILALSLSADGNHLVAIGSDAVAYRSSDGGSTFSTTDVYPSLPIDVEEIAEDWPGFNLHHAQISDDFRHWVITGFCEAFISHDGANTWQRVTGNKELGGWGDYDLCLDDLYVDNQFEPQFASVDVTGRLASGEYVFIFDDGRWRNLCSFDTVAYLLDSVGHCEDFEEISANAKLQATTGVFESPWKNDSKTNSGIFELHHHPLKDNVEFSRVADVVENSEGELLYISYLGIAASSDRGQRWNTLIGGIPIAEKSARLADDEWVALWDDAVYISVDEEIWQRDLAIEYVYDFLPLFGVALVATGEEVIRFSEGSNNSRVLESEVYRLQAYGDVVWALGGDTIAASRDQGQSWQMATTRFEASESVCAEACLGFDDRGQLWEAENTGSQLTLNIVGGLPAFSEDSDYINDLWAAADLSLVIVAVSNSVNDLQMLWVSNNRGRTFNAFPNPVEYVEHVLFPAPGTAFLEGDRKAHWIRDAGNIMASEPSPLPFDADSACLPAQGVIALQTWDVHPEWPDDEAQYVIYSNDLGQSWWTMKLDGDVCAG